MSRTMSADRVSLLFQGYRRRQREIITPEGVVLGVEVATRTERLSAFLIDLVVWSLSLIAIFCAILFAALSGNADEIGLTLALFLAFLIRLLYFIQFELIWRGRTPGKRLLRLRVIDRAGGALTPAAIVARNLIREVELFLPLGLLISLIATRGMETWQQLTTFAWIFAVTLVPFFNKDHLRMGDIIAGTLVIATPRCTLAVDLADDARRYTFAPDQLEAYGAFELQVLEEVLRQAPSAGRNRLMTDIVAKICRRIRWNGTVPQELTEQFLRDFYTAERAALERDQLFGRLRQDKDARPEGVRTTVRR